jgi:hypothetical protein
MCNYIAFSIPAHKGEEVFNFRSICELLWTEITSKLGVTGSQTKKLSIPFCTSTKDGGDWSYK